MAYHNGFKTFMFLGTIFIFISAKKPLHVHHNPLCSAKALKIKIYSECTISSNNVTTKSPNTMYILCKQVWHP